MKLKILVSIIYLLLSAELALSECKIRIVEYEDRTEVVCEPDTATQSLQHSQASPKTIRPPSANIVDPDVIQVEKLSNEQLALINANASPEKVAAKVVDAETVISIIDKKCESVGNEKLLEMRGDLMQALEAKHCRENKNIAIPYIPAMMVRSGKYYAKNGNKQAAKIMFRDVIIRFVGDKYKSQVKEAEFGLDDLKNSLVK